MRMISYTALFTALLATACTVEEQSNPLAEKNTQQVSVERVKPAGSMCSTNSWDPKITDNKQYVSIGFDGSYSLGVWRETLDFAKKHDVKFTFYIVGTHLLTNANSDLYLSPLGKRGKSDVGFGGSIDEVKERLKLITRAFNEGHEIASHANGHYDGSSWSYEQWDNEFLQYRDFVENAFSINGISEEEPGNWKEITSSIKGFRAPLLAHNDNMYLALAKHGYVYDTSFGHKVGYNPNKHKSGILLHPLAILKTPIGNTLSMDYNFYFRELKLDQPKSFHNMTIAYDYYFETSAKRNSAPMQIGHHFSRWNDGVYWDSLKHFVKSYCDDEDVICGTNIDLSHRINSCTSEFTNE